MHLGSALLRLLDLLLHRLDLILGAAGALGVWR